MLSRKEKLEIRLLRRALINENLRINLRVSQDEILDRLNKLTYKELHDDQENKHKTSG